VHPASNFFAKVDWLLCADKCIPLPGGVKEGFKPLSLKTLIVYWSIWGTKGRKVFGRWRRKTDCRDRASHGSVAGHGKDQVSVSYSGAD